MASLLEWVENEEGGVTRARGRRKDDQGVEVGRDAGMGVVSGGRSVESGGAGGAIRDKKTLRGHRSLGEAEVEETLCRDQRGRQQRLFSERA
jgi:hypothetical protein